jgi:hypothetical protein
MRGAADEENTAAPHGGAACAPQRTALDVAQHEPPQEPPPPLHLEMRGLHYTPLVRTGAAARAFARR